MAMAMGRGTRIIRGLDGCLEVDAKAARNLTFPRIRFYAWVELWEITARIFVGVDVDVGTLNTVL